MSAGFSFGAACYPTAAIAAGKACSATHGVTDAGVVTCTAVTVEEGGTSAVLQLATTGAEGLPLGNTMQVMLQPCERFDYEYYGPVYGMVLTALVAFAGVKLLRNIFSRETA